MIKVLHARITGRVQGVGYRAWAADEARRQGLTGWMRNRRDGSVEAVFRGEEEAVNRMLEACRQGPWGARVDNVATATIADGGWKDFSIQPTV